MIVGRLQLRAARPTVAQTPAPRAPQSPAARTAQNKPGCSPGFPATQTRAPSARHPALRQTTTASPAAARFCETPFRRQARPAPAAPSQTSRPTPRHLAPAHLPSDHVRSGTAARCAYRVRHSTSVASASARSAAARSIGPLLLRICPAPGFSSTSTNSLPVGRIATRGRGVINTSACPVSAKMAISIGRTIAPLRSTTSPIRIEAPSGNTFCPGAGSTCSSRTVAASTIADCSTGTTASAPSGSGAPVMMREHRPRRAAQASAQPPPRFLRSPAAPAHGPHSAPRTHPSSPCHAAAN